MTIPAKDLRALGVEAGKEVKITVEPIDMGDNIATDYEAFKAQYGETLKNLADQ